MSFENPGDMCAGQVHPAFRGLIAATLVVTATTMNSGFANDEAPHFEMDIQPLLVTHCYECHGRSKQSADVDLRSVTLMTDPREWNTPVVIRGEPQQSRLIEVLEAELMPPNGRMADEQIELIRSWIAADCPADSPDAVHGATFFQNWGIVLCVLAVSNTGAVGFLWRDALTRGPLMVVLAGLPVIALEVSTWYWYPPDLYGVGAAAVMGLGVVMGGILIAAANRKSLYAGAGWGLLAPVGLFFLVRSGDEDPASPTRDDLPALPGRS